MNRLNRGFTLVETIFTVVLFLLVFAMVSQVFTYSKSTTATMEKLDVYHDSRTVNFTVANELKYATNVLFPKTIGGKSTYQLVFRNALNQVLILYLNDTGQLVLVNYDRLNHNRISRGRVLAENVKEFSVRRLFSNLIEYKIAVEFKDKREYSITNKVNIASLL